MCQKKAAQTQQAPQKRFSDPVVAVRATALDVLGEVAASADELGVRVLAVAQANDRVLARLALANDTAIDDLKRKLDELQNQLAELSKKS